MKLTLRQILLLALLAGAMLALVSVFHFVNQSGAQVKVAPAVSSAAVINSEEPGLPIRLKIPAINVDAAVESIGLTADGAVGVPRDPNSVAWYNLGPRPGSAGSAIITGHYGRWKTGGGSVFDDLNKIKINDEIFVVDENNATASFVVREIKSYDEKASAPEIFHSTDEQAHLNLITCEGEWNKVLKSYPSRLVIFTDKK